MASVDEATTTINVRSRLHPAGRRYAIVRVGDLPRAQQLQLVSIKRRAVRYRLRPARVSRALREMAAILVPSLEPDVLGDLDDEALGRVLDLTMAVSS